MSSKNPNRTAVSNGTKLLPGQVDGRSRFARRYRDLIQDMSGDLGGADRLSTLQHQLIRRAAALATRCEMAEADLAAGRAIDSERFASDVALIVRVARQLGLERVARDVTGQPDLKTYLAAMAGRPPLTLEHDASDEHQAAASPAAAASPGADAEGSHHTGDSGPRDVGDRTDATPAAEVASVA